MRCAGRVGILATLALLAAPGARAQISLSTVIDMALRNNPKVRMAAAEVQRAQAGVSQSVDVYKPNLVLGSSLGDTYGFPLGQPEVFSLTAQSLAFSFSQRDYIRSARMALEAAKLQLKDAQEQTILDTAIDYIDLVKTGQQVAALDQETGDAAKLVEIEDDRVSAGRDTKVDLTEAQLTGAQVDLNRLDLLDHADMLRDELAHLTGLRPGDMTPDPKSIPPAPSLSQEGDTDAAVFAGNNAVKAAYATAKSKLYTAFGDERQKFRPTISFVANYGLFSSFNNYAQYYLHFQENNFGAGVQIQFPLFNASFKAKQLDASAQAAYAAAQADQAKNQTGEQALQLQRSLAELTAREHVAEFQNELAQDRLDQITTQLQSGGGNPDQALLTPKDQEQAQIQERARYVDMLDARYQLTQVKLNLLRSLGGIEGWARSAIPLGSAPAGSGIDTPPTPPAKP